MSEANASSAPEVAVTANVKITKSVEALQKADAKQAVAFDNLRQTAKTETVAHSYTQKQLTSLLLEAGLDAARASEIKGFVFPAHSAARAELDKAIAHNAQQTDAKNRIAKPVILALQRDKDGTLTLEKAIEEHKAKAAGTVTRGARPPEGTATTATTATAPVTATATAAQTAKAIEDKLGDLFAAALNFGKANGYDEADCSAVFEEWASKIFPPDSESEENGEENGEESAE